MFHPWPAMGGCLSGLKDIQTWHIRIQHSDAQCSISRRTFDMNCSVYPGQSWLLPIVTSFFFFFFLRGRFIETNKNYIQDSRERKTLEIQ